MNGQVKIYNYKTISNLVVRLRDDLKYSDFVLIYAYNGTGKTRISMEFKELGKKKNNGKPDTLYFNAFTEDLFSWDNDLKDDKERILKLNPYSKFFDGFKELELDTRIRPFLQRYADFDFTIFFEERKIIFKRDIRVKEMRDGETIERTEVVDSIKVSRGEENVFIWCVYLAICQLAIDGAEAYGWVKNFYIDDPISSLDDNNAIAVASDLGKLLLSAEGKIKTIISSHHILFFNVMCNELKNKKPIRYFLHKNSNAFTLRRTDDTPYFQHVAILSELNDVLKSGNIKTFHFNMLRAILEKTASFFGFNDFGKCISGLDDQVLFERALNLLSHGNYSVYEPVEMNEDNKALFTKILNTFLEKYQFDLPSLLTKKKASKLQKARLGEIVGQLDKESIPAERVKQPIDESVSPNEEAKNID
jgi:hypothetical protein